MNVRESCRAFIKDNIDLAVFIFMMFLPDLLIRFFVHFGYGKLPFLCDLLVLLVFCAILIFLPLRLRHILEYILVCISSSYCFAQTVHYDFFSSFFSFKKLSVLQELIGVRGEILSKLHISYLVFLLPLFLMILTGKIQKKGSDYHWTMKAGVVVLCILVVFAGFKYVDSYLKKTEEDGWLSESYLYETFHNKNRFMSRFGAYQYLYKDFLNILNDGKSGEISLEEKQEIAEFVSTHHSSEKNAYSGMFQGKNLILILAESFDFGAIDPEMTPTLYKLSKESIFFDNYYSPIFQSATGDCEFISQTSMLPSVDYGTTSYTFYNNTYPESLANLFRDHGYSANSFHSNITNFYNRELFHESLGFETFYDVEKLGLHYWEGYQEGINWLNDKDLFHRTIELSDSDHPFYDFVITVSGHMPYKNVRSELKDNLKKIDDSSFVSYSQEAKCYLAAQMNFDQGMERLLVSLEEKDILEDTVIVIFGDHYPYGISEQVSYQEIVGLEGYEKFKVPFMIYDPTQKGKVISTLGSSFDIYPTICNLFGFDIEDSYTVGKDLFEEGGRRVIFADRSILTPDFYYDAINNETVILTDSYSQEQLYEQLNDVNDIFTYGHKILTCDYYQN